MILESGLLIVNQHTRKHVDIFNRSWCVRPKQNGVALAIDASAVDLHAAANPAINPSPARPSAAVLAPHPGDIGRIGRRFAKIHAY